MSTIDSDELINYFLIAPKVLHESCISISLIVKVIIIILSLFQKIANIFKN